MLIETKELKKGLYEIKLDAQKALERATTEKVKGVILARLSVLDAIFIWIDRSEKQGGMKMEDLKLGEITTWEKKARPDSIDAKIEHDAKQLEEIFKASKGTKNAIKVTVDTVSWATFQNRTYALNGKKISDHIVPRKDDTGAQYLVYLAEAPIKRRKTA